MNNEEIIRMATEAGLMQVHSCCNVLAKLCNLDVWQGNIQAFFALAFAAGAAREREACVKACESLRDEDGYEVWGVECAAAIRARMK